MDEKNGLQGCGHRVYRPHKDLDVWKLSMELCRDVYKLTSRLPVEERYGLTSQLRRAAVSIPSNIAEGAARSTSSEFNQFLSIAQGSLAELDTQLDLCANYLHLIDNEDVHELMEKVERVGRMITALRRSLKTRK